MNRTGDRVIAGRLRWLWLLAVACGLLALAVLAVQRSRAPVAGSTVIATRGPACRACGVVAQVREVPAAAPGYRGGAVAGGRDALVVTLLLALTGRQAAAVPARTYEVSVRLNDGSIVAVREGGVARWKVGDAVRLIGGRVESLS